MNEANIDPKDALEAIERDKKARIEAATTEINAVLDKYKVSLDASIIVTARGNVPHITLMTRS